MRIFFFAGLAIGLFLFFKPERSIEIQKRFYRRINWRIEPIDFPKEIRNTRIMGLFLLFISLVFFFWRKI